MTTKRSADNARVTPDMMETKQGSTPRSRKCLDLRIASSPLSERQNIPSPLRTPRSYKNFCPDSPASSQSRQEEVSRSPSPLSDQSEMSIPFSNYSENIPSTFPKTPQPELRRLSSKPRIGSTIKIDRTAFRIEKKVKKETNTSTPNLPEIVTKSFYSSGPKPPQITSSNNSIKASSSKSKSKSERKRRSVGRGGSIKSHRSRSSGSFKRKRTGTFGGGGVGHAIKKPKLNKSIETKPVKISELPVPVMVDLPSSSSAYNQSTKTPSRPSSMTPKTTGQLSMSGSTKVSFEVKGGQFVFRAKSKTSTTPVRRSPRKHMSPLKADYFHSGGKRTNTKSSSKLFSPEHNFLDAENKSPKKKSIPSPVKFESNEVDEDLSDLISALAKDQAIELNVPVSDPGVTSMMSTSTVSDLPDVSSAINNILNDLSSGDDSLSDSVNDNSTCSNNIQDDNASNYRDNKLFPIFYKNPTNFSVNSQPQAGDKKKFVCSSLSENQTIIDAGQKLIGPVQCNTCGSVYSVGDPIEEASHDKIHQGRLDKLKLTGWKLERTVGHFPSGRVLCVKPGDHASHWKKVEEVLSIVDEDLGFSEIGIRYPDKTKVFLYVADKKVVGLLLAENIEKAYKIIPNNDVEISGKVYCCSETPVPVWCGISRIWVLADFRRAKVASSLVDCMRSGFYQDHYLRGDQFAFSDPTMDGIKFATKYMKSDEFLVYNR